MAEIEMLREKLHLEIEEGSKLKILLISQELDNEIVKFLRDSIDDKIVSTKGKCLKILNGHYR